MILTDAAKWVVRRAVATIKGVRLEGNSSVRLGTKVLGRGSVVLSSGSALTDGVTVDLRGGDLRVGARSLVARGAIVRVGDHIDIGEDSTVMHYSILYGEGGITIGDRVLIGNHCLITSIGHLYEGSEPVLMQGMSVAPVVIGNDVWVGAYSLIDPGVSIGEGAIIGAHSYVKDDIPANAVAVGSPARVVKFRGD